MNINFLVMAGIFFIIWIILFIIGIKQLMDSGKIPSYTQEQTTKGEVNK